VGGWRSVHLRFHPLGLLARSSELFLKLLELLRQQFGLAFEPLDLRSLRRGLRRSRGGDEQPHAQEGAARHQLAFEIHDRLLW
jgi:hypothetical protein